MAWRIRSDELRRRRLDKMMDQTELARVSGVSVRTIHSAEKSDAAVTLVTVDCLAKALDCKRTDIATSVDKRAKCRAEKPTDAKPRAPGDRVRMADLRAIALTLPEPEPLEIDGERVPMLSVLKYHQCFTAYLARDGQRHWIEGEVADEHGLSPAEAGLLGARSGEAARFEIRSPVGEDGHTVCITVHTSRPELTIAMQDAAHKTLRVVVRLVALRDLSAGAGLTFFMRERPSPWALVVERVLRVEKRGVVDEREETRSLARRQPRHSS